MLQKFGFEMKFSKIYFKGIKFKKASCPKFNPPHEMFENIICSIREIFEKSSQIPPN